MLNSNNTPNDTIYFEISPFLETATNFSSEPSLKGLMSSISYAVLDNITLEKTWFINYFTRKTYSRF